MQKLHFDEQKNGASITFSVFIDDFLGLYLFYLCTYDIPYYLTSILQSKCLLDWEKYAY